MDRPLSDELKDLLTHLALHDVSLRFDEAMVLSGAAFRHYFFSPIDNHAWLVEFPEEHWRTDTMRVENYGLYESIAGHTGWASRTWTSLTGAEFVQLLRYEQEHQRRIHIRPSPTCDGGWVTAFTVSRDGLTLELQQQASTITLEHQDLATIDAFVEGLAVIQTLRHEGEDIIPAARRHALSDDVCRWAIQHHGAKKEIVYDVQAFYAAGDRAWSLLIEFLTNDTPAAPPSHKRDGARAYVRAHLRELAIARASAARFFETPAYLQEHFATRPHGAAPLAAIAQQWEHVHAAIETACEATDDDLPLAIADAQQADAAAFAAFAHWMSNA